MDRFKFSDYMSLLKQLMDAALWNKNEDIIKFRLLSVEKESGKVTIQVVGSARSFHANVKELIESDLLMSFSKPDAVVIAHLGTRLTEQENKKKGFKYLFGKLFPAIKGGRSTFEVQNETGSVEKRPCSDALSDSTLVATATDKEKVSIGYLAGYEACKEKRENI